MWDPHTRSHSVARTLCSLALLVSISIPSPAVVLAQTAEPDPGIAEPPASEPAPTPETDDAEPDPASAAQEAEEPQVAPDEEEGEGEEPPLESLLISGGDPFHDDEKKAINEKLRLEPAPLNGALHYAYPLTIPPGRNGMQPDLSLVYSSQPTSDTNLPAYSTR